MSTIARAPLLVSLILALTALTLPARGSDFIAVQATGWVEAAPDMLTLSVAAQATGKSVESLQTTVDKQAQLVVQASLELGVLPDDIDTSGLSVNPAYQWRDGERKYLGQTVRREMVVVLRDLEKYGALVQALSRFDLMDWQQPRLGHSQIEELQLQALENALGNGVRKARCIAESLGAALGKVLEVEERGVVPRAPSARIMAAEAMNSGAPDIQFGQRRIEAAVTMRFAIN